MIGRMWYRVRTKFQHGLRAAWYRDVVRPKILMSAPVTGLIDNQCEIHVLTSRDDFLNLMWALKSFYVVSGRKFALAIHNDGTLSDEQLKSLGHHFPDARIIDRETADEVVLDSLTDYLNCREFRQTNLLSPKLFDFRHYLNSDRMFLLDSDVLFFEDPVELLRRLEAPDYRLNSVNGDVATAYTVDPVDVQHKFGFQMIERFNSGLGLIHRDSIRLDWIEEFLELPSILSHVWRIEQTLFALCSCRFGVELLPPEYDVFLNGPLNGQPSRHYVGAVRHEMYREGIQRLHSRILNE